MSQVRYAAFCRAKRDTRDMLRLREEIPHPVYHDGQVR